MNDPAAGPDPEGFGEPQGGAPMDAEARRRVSLAVRSGEAVANPADAPAAVELARLAQRRLEDRTLPSALRISGGVMLPSDRIHAPNERLLLANYYRGVRAAAYAFEEFARPEVAAALRNPAG